MDNRNRGRDPRRRRDRVYCPPGKRLEERREQLRGYAGFSFTEPEEKASRYDERNDRYAGGRRGDERSYDRRERYDRRGGMYGDYDRRDDRGGYDRYRDRGERYDRRDDRYDGYYRADDRYDDQWEDPAPPHGGGYPPFAVMPGYPPPYPGGAYPPYDPYNGFMSEEDYNEFVQFEEYEDRYGRDFDRYEGGRPAEPAPEPEPDPEPETVREEFRLVEEKTPSPAPQPDEEMFSSFEDDFDDEDDFAASDCKKGTEEPFFAQYRINRPVAHDERTVPQQSAVKPDTEHRPQLRDNGEALYTDRPRRPEPAAATAPVVPPEPELPPQPAASSMTKYLVLAAVVMCLLCGWLVSSGHIIEETGVRKTQRMASFDIQTGLDSMSVNVMNDVRGLPKVYTLPLSETPAHKPIESGYSSYTDDNGVKHDTYTDDTISVDVSRSKYTVGKYTVIANVAKVKIAHPTQLRSAFAGGEFGSTRTKLSKLAQNNNAVVGINGELYNHTGRNNILIRQGTMYRDTPQTLKTLFIDSNGDFTIKNAQEAVAEGILNDPENKIYQTVSFGPALVIDGELQQRKDDATHFSYRNPRSAIGQLGPLEYLLVSVEGRTDESKGLNTNHMAMLMHELGCIQAYNLDGGQSSEIVFKGKPYNNISNSGERQFSDLLYFGTALPEE